MAAGELNAAYLATTPVIVKRYTNRHFSTALQCLNHQLKSDDSADAVIFI